MTQRQQQLERVAQMEILLEDSIRAPGQECLATFWRQASLGTSYWRCYVPAKALPGQVLGFKTERLKWLELYEMLEVEGQRGAAIWQFLGDDARARIALQLQDQGTRTLMEVDDNYIQSPGLWYGWKETHAEAMATGIGYSHEQHRHLCGLVDGIIVSTPALAEAYGEYNDNVYVCPNSIDQDDWDLPEHEDDGILRIGYAGSLTHIFDYAIVKKALKWASRQKDVKVYLIGFNAFGFNGEVIPWSDNLSDLRKTLSWLDVGICPLQDREWNRYKSDVKALEYAMAGALPVVSHTEAYRPWWEMGWEYVATTPDEWMETIRHLVKNRDEIKDEAETARQWVLGKRTIDMNIDKWKVAVTG